MTEKLLLSKTEAAVALGISARSLQSLERAGRIASVRIGGRVLFTPVDLAAFIETNRTTSAKISNNWKRQKNSRPITDRPEI